MTFGVDGGRFAAVGHGLDVMVLGAAGKGGVLPLTPKSGHRRAAEGVEFSWRWNVDSIAMDLKVIWEMSDWYVFAKKTRVLVVST